MESVGLTAQDLYTAVLNSDNDSVNQLVNRHGVMIINRPNGARYGRTALHSAVVLGNVFMAQHLIALGADPDVLDSEGIAPLYEASLAGNLDLVEMLLRAGATATVATRDGSTRPIDIAERHNHTQVVAALNSAGGRGDPVDIPARGDEAADSPPLWVEVRDNTLSDRYPSSYDYDDDDDLAPRGAHAQHEPRHAARNEQPGVARNVANSGGSAGEGANLENTPRMELWNAHRVEVWLRSLNILSHEQVSLFTHNGVDGKALLKLGRVELVMFLEATPSQATQLIDAIHERAAECDGSVKHAQEREKFAGPLQFRFERRMSCPNWPFSEDRSFARIKDEEELKCLQSRGGEATGDPPPEYLCPITQEVMYDPVVLPDGHTYERNAIVTWLAQSDVSPVTQEIGMNSGSLIPNYCLRKLTDDWRRQSEG